MNTSKQKTLLVPLILVGIMFFVIGFGVGISGFLIPALRDAFDLTTMQSYLVTVAIFSAFVVFGGPAGWLIKKLGYRITMMLSFIVMAMGMLLFVPSASVESFPLFLVALFVGGIGNTLLQASVNPYVTIIGPTDSAAMRMSLMGIMNKLAWWIAPLFLGLFIDISNVELTDIALPFYIVTGILVSLGIITYFMPLPEVLAEGEDESEASASSYAATKTSILQFPHLLLGVVALFIYVGIETLPMVSVIDFAKATFPDATNLDGFAKYVTIGLVVGYVFGVFAIPKYISQTKALIMFSVIGIASSLLLILAPAHLAFYAIVLISFANSLMWPAIWPLAISDLGKFTKTGSSLLVMAIVGGAVIPLIYGYLVDSIQGTAERASVAHFQSAYWILVPCYLLILYFAMHGHKIRK
jgi:FHS family L-fucose permease-like MFS transporter